MALLASGKEEYRPMLAEYAKKVAELRMESMATWHYGYALMFLAEYAIATGDQSVMPGLKRLALEAAHGQSGVGTWGHKFARPDGNLNGYGAMNSPGMPLAVAMVLAREAGVKDPALDKAIDRAASFLRWYVNKGAPPYGDHAPWPGHEDNGKSSNAAVLFDLLGDREAATFFAKMSVAAYDERERGHTGNFFNILWAMPGVSRCGPHGQRCLLAGAGVVLRPRPRLGREFPLSRFPGRRRGAREIHQLGQHRRLPAGLRAAAQKPPHHRQGTMLR